MSEPVPPIGADDDPAVLAVDLRRSTCAGRPAQVVAKRREYQRRAT